jgi:hypothetical protein
MSKIKNATQTQSPEGSQRNDDQMFKTGDSCAFVTLWLNYTFRIVLKSANFIFSIDLLFAKHRPHPQPSVPQTLNDPNPDCRTEHQYVF